MHQLEKFERVKEYLSASNRAAALTGAGISTPSGIPDFRSPGSGLWQDVDPFKVASIFGFRQQPKDFFDWFRPVARIAFNAEPNSAHLALAQLEKRGPLKGIITQNVDMLHSKAGSEVIYELHGHWRQSTCIHCYRSYATEPFLKDYIDAGVIPYCENCGGVLKPNVILYGEQLPIDVFNNARQLARTCDLMLVAGSSLEVTPASDLPIAALDNGAKLIIINLEPTYLDPYADVVFHADVVDVLPILAADLDA